MIEVNGGGPVSANVVVVAMVDGAEAVVVAGSVDVVVAPPVVSVVASMPAQPTTTRARARASRPVALDVAPTDDEAEEQAAGRRPDQ